MATIVYLDVDDEITSAATRIRSAGEPRVALVLPFGSRLATSRINFRLLSREATLNGKRLDIVAPDASARALAASAGLPVFSSVVEYEDALEDAGAAGGEAPPQAPAEEARPARATTRGGSSSRAAGMVAAGAATGAASGASAGAATGAASGAASGAAAGTQGARSVRPMPRGGYDDARDGRDAGAGEPSDHRAEPRMAPTGRRVRIGRGALAGLAILVLTLVILGAAAFILLPSAEITVTPRIEGIGPIAMEVRADPDATAVDAEAGIIPAQLIEIPVTASGEFPATGKRVARTKATGGVRWTNCDPTAAYTIPAGTVVRTADGVGFATEESVFLPVAPIVSGNQLDCQSSEVAVTAVDAGPGGNVAAATIRVVPARYNRNVIRVTNPAATSGGTREEFPRVVQQDVDAALEQLRMELDQQFVTALQDPAGIPAGATVFPDTATPGDPVPDVDPATLLDQEVASFTLSMSATGTVLAVDSAPVEAIAESRLAGSVSQGYELVDGSISVEVGEGVVAGGVVSFPAVGTAKQVRPADAAALEASVLGLSRDEARAALEPWGEVSIVLWPQWVGSVPTLDQRVALTVLPPVDAAPTVTPLPSAAPPSGEASDDASASEPVPSGG